MNYRMNYRMNQNSFLSMTPVATQDGGMIYLLCNDRY